MKPGKKKRMCDAKGGETKWLPCLTKSKCGRVRPRSRPRANANCETWSVYLVQESGGKNCAISTADACRQKSNNIECIRVNRHPTRIISTALSLRPPNLFRIATSTTERTPGFALSLSHTFSFSPFFSSPRTRAVSRTHRLMKKTYWHGNTVDRQIKRSSTPPPCDLWTVYFRNVRGVPELSRAYTVPHPRIFQRIRSAC